MKDLKGNIQKNNMKKLVISAFLGMFCYCSNNAMKKQIKIDDVLMTMLEGQINIFNAKNEIGKHKKKIYSTIKNEDGKVKKGKLLEFIKNQFTEEEQKETEFENKIRRIEQYFHLEEKGKEAECTKDNLTERFWVDNENKNEKINKVEDEIKQYFVAIYNAESGIDEAFKEYYEAKKAEKKDVENVEDVVIEEIMEECLGNTKTNNIQKDFLANLGKLYDEFGKIYDEDFNGNKKATLATIRKRITLKNKITKEDFKSFLKQKIGIEEKKEVEPKEEEKKQEGGCPCCDCWEKKKNIEVIEVQKRQQKEKDEAAQ